MDIYKGLLVKTWGERIVKLERETAPGYWLCDDGCIRVSETLREANTAEQELYAISHTRTRISGNSSEDILDQIAKPRRKTSFR